VYDSEGGRRSRVRVPREVNGLTGNGNS